MKQLLGKPLAELILNDIRNEIQKNCVLNLRRWNGRDQGLLMEDPPILKIFCTDKTQPYYKGICKDALKCGITVLDGYSFPNNFCDGSISLDKDFLVPQDFDMDGGRFYSCTAEAIERLLRFYDIPISGADVCILGRSRRVGGSLAELMCRANATVTLCHSKTKDISKHVRDKDIVVSCTGNDWDLAEISPVSPETVVIDLDGAYRNIKDCKAIAPFVGGIGPVTRAILMSHVLVAAWGGKDEERSNK